MDGEGQPHITDFGLAKRVEGEAGMTRTGAILGTPSYMAPEQASGEKGAMTTLTDVYGLGAILYEQLTGRPPFGAATPLETVLQVREKEPEPPSRLNRRVDRDLEAVCLKCLAKEPQRRYASAAALAEDLEHWLAGEPLSVRPAGVGRLVWIWLRQNIRAAGWVVLLGLAIGTLVVLFCSGWFAELSLITLPWWVFPLTGLIDALGGEHFELPPASRRRGRRARRSPQQALDAGGWRDRLELPLATDHRPRGRGIGKDSISLLLQECPQLLPGAVELCVQAEGLELVGPGVQGLGKRFGPADLEALIWASPFRDRRSGLPGLLQKQAKGVFNAGDRGVHVPPAAFL